MLDENGSRDAPVPPGSQHEEFLELCAFAASGSLDDAEVKKLRDHLALCSECRDAMKDFDVVVNRMIPELIPELGGAPSLDPSFSQEKAEASFQKRLAAEKESEPLGVEGASPPAVRRGRFFRTHLHRYEIWIPLVASAVLCATFGILSYRTGKNHGIEWARLEERNQPSTQAALREPPSVIPADTNARDSGLVARDAALADLRREIAQKSSEVEKLKALVASQQVALRTGAEDKSGVTEERDRLLQQVSANEETLRATEQRLKTLERERSEYVIHTASLEKSVTDLSRSLQERERDASEQQELLAKDRDIRDLISARE